MPTARDRKDIQRRLKVRLKKALLFARDWWIPLSGLAAASWGIWKFFFDISVPVNIIVDLNSRVDHSAPLAAPIAATAEADLSSGRVTPVRFSVTAKNISSRKTLNIHNPVWIAYGTNIYYPRKKYASSNDSLPVLAEREFGTTYLMNGHHDSRNKSADDASKRRLLDHAYGRTLIGVGTLFGNDTLKPLEQIKAEHVIPVISGQFDILEVRVMIPTTDAGKRLGPLGWFGSEVSHEKVKAYLNMHLPGDKNMQVNPSFIFYRNFGGASGQERLEIMDLEQKKNIGASFQVSLSQLWLGQVMVESSENKP